MLICNTNNKLVFIFVNGVINMQSWMNSDLNPGKGSYLNGACTNTNTENSCEWCENYYHWYVQQWNGVKPVSFDFPKIVTAAYLENAQQIQFHQAGPFTRTQADNYFIKSESEYENIQIVEGAPGCFWADHEPA
jgi:hypothetical protein